MSDENGDWVCGQKELLQNYGLTERTIQEFSKGSLTPSEKSKARRLFNAATKELERVGTQDFTFVRVLNEDIPRKRESAIVTYKKQEGKEKTSGSCKGFFEFLEDVHARVSKDPKNRTVETRKNCYSYHARRIIQERLEGQPIALPRKPNKKTKASNQNDLRKAIVKFLSNEGLDKNLTSQILCTILEETDRHKSGAITTEEAANSSHSTHSKKLHR